MLCRPLLITESLAKQNLKPELIVLQVLVCEWLQLCL
jgi:hypothetical protein